VLAHAALFIIDGVPCRQDTAVGMSLHDIDPEALARGHFTSDRGGSLGGLTGSFQLDVDRTTLIGRALRPATYTVTEVDVNDFLGVVDEPAFVATGDEQAAGAATVSAPTGSRLAPPSFAPFVAVLGLLKTFDWGDDFLFDYRTGTAMFGEQSIEFHRPLRVGESVAISAAISDVYEKQGKRRFDVIEVSFQISGSEEGDPLMSGQQSYILFK